MLSSPLSTAFNDQLYPYARMHGERRISFQCIGREASIAEADFGNDRYHTKDAEASSDSEYTSDMDFDRVRLPPGELAGCQAEMAEYNARVNSGEGDPSIVKRSKTD